MLNRLRLRPFLIVIPLLLLTVGITADEGMYPMSEIHKLDLRAKGLEIDVTDIYNPDGVSLVDAICRVGGGTGEFVSEDGLILTNHHIAFRAVTNASTTENDYLRDGFTARERGDEILATGYECRITESYRDVSDEILGMVTSEMSPSERSDNIRQKMREMAKQEAGERENISCEVSEMFPGKSYVLFTYRIITDVRLVYVPPVSIGNYGGETDNWIWPRHTGDFSFLRAYVAPDGSTRDYNVENVPYTPKRWLRVAPKGVSEDDFVFILGFPGRTYRHKAAEYISLYENTILPLLSKRYDWMIETMDVASADDRELQLKFANLSKGLSNATKNYKGKMLGLGRLNLVEKRRREEAELQKYIMDTPELKEKYSSTLSDLTAVYKEYETLAPQEINATLLGRNSYMQMLLSVIGYVDDEEHSEDEEHSDGEEHSEDEAKKMAEMNDARYAEINAETQTEFLTGLLRDAAALPENQRIESVVTIAGSGSGETEDVVRERIIGIMKEGSIADAASMKSLLDNSMDDLRGSKDKFLVFALELRELNKKIIERRKARNGTLNRLEAEFLEAKMAWKKTDFIPDANLTLRLTYGYIRGYQPADATSYSPQTTLRGVIEKHTGEEPFVLPKELIELYNSGIADSDFIDEALKDVPVGMLYNMDTTGGNSGSPVLNARGELVGVNFDRAYEATINDYQWREDYSRSIGVDIRYVLFIAKYLGKADFLLEELGY